MSPKKESDLLTAMETDPRTTGAAQAATLLLKQLVKQLVRQAECDFFKRRAKHMNKESPLCGVIGYNFVNAH